MSPANVLSTAWEAATATDVLDYVEYSDLLLISRMYTEQDRHTQQTKLVGQVIYELLLKGDAGDSFEVQKPAGCRFDLLLS